ncbi:hypothetical protein GGF42_007689 [Coemansia sp. RSA 2424]|nr:hypothetical protein GGF42_007689 [Coemansia sp. RSA 2424]
MYRHDDVVLTLQLLAYLSKTPSQRQQLHECPLLYTQMRAIYGTGSAGACAGPTLQLNAANSSGPSSGYATQGDLDSPHRAAQSAAQANAAAGIPVTRRRQSAGDATVDVFSIVEKFTVHKAFPSDMAYWSAIVMRNGCRRDETRNYCRQCAYSKCQKWELHPNEFAKCRRCRKAKYCSKVCQSSAWQEGHRNWCNERNPSSAGNPGSMDGDAAVVAAAAATVTGSVVALAGTMPAQQPQPQQYQPQPPPQPQQQQQPFYAQPTLGSASPVASQAQVPPHMGLPPGGASSPGQAIELGAATTHRSAAGGPVPSAAHGSHHNLHHHHHHHPYRSAHPESQPPAPGGRSRSRGRGANL